MENGQTDDSGNLEIVSAAASGETPGGLDHGDDNGTTDKNGNLMIKFYA